MSELDKNNQKISIEDATLSYLIFSSFDVGGLPYKMADILNRHGVKTYYISIQDQQYDHNSTRFHYGDKVESWNLTPLVKGLFFPTDLKIALKDIRKKYIINACLATGLKSYILKKAGINYIYWCYGSDLDQSCFYRMWDKSYTLRGKIYTILVPSAPKTIRMEARRSIRHSDSVMIAPYQVDAYRRLGIRKKLVFFPHFLNTTEYGSLLKKKEESKRLICRDINASQFFFSSVRQIWCGSKSFMSDNKGNDIILNSYRKYHGILNDDKSKLVLVEKGEDVERSKSLARDLKIDHLVVWIKEMPRDRLDDYYGGASICFGQFAIPCLSFASLEPLACGTPCISYYLNYNVGIQGIPYYSEMPPIMNSNNPDEIAQFMINLLSNKKDYDDIAYRSWLWAKENCSEEKFVKSFVGLFEDKDKVYIS